MRVYVLLLLLIPMFFASCRDKKTPEPQKKQFSTWIINNQDTFTTNNVDSDVACNPDHSYCTAGILSKDSNNWFSLAFRLDYFPTSGKYQLYIPPGGGSVLCALKLYYNNQFYYHTPSRIDTIYASVVDNKPSYAMPPNWFVSYDNPTGDSIIIQGIFNVP